MSQQYAEDHGPKGVVTSLNDAIRDNPLAAGLMGAGLAWALFARVRPPSLGSFADTLKGTASAVGAVADGGGSMVAEAAKAGSRIADSASRMKDSAHDALNTVASGGSSLVAAAGETIIGGVQSSAKAGQRYGASAQQVLSENLERQPLLLGAIGLAIGACIASTFASTKFEGELMGERGSAAREKLQGLAHETKDFAATRAKEVLDVVKDEAQAQGLTPDAAKDAFKDVSQKVKDVSGSAREAVTSRVS